jgi:stage V sporulation protein AD
LTFSPAAADTILTYFNNTKTLPKDFDVIFTGDLGYVGSELLYKLCIEQGIDISAYHNDCGLMLYNPEKQDVHSGGSGCGCSASVLTSHILKNLEKGEYKRVLFCATGALLSPTTVMQGENIPSIAHLVEFKGE